MLCFTLLAFPKAPGEAQNTAEQNKTLSDYVVLNPHAYRGKPLYRGENADASPDLRASPLWT